MGAIGALCLPKSKTENSNIIYANYIPIIVTSEYSDFKKFFKERNGFDLNLEQSFIAYSYFFQPSVRLFYPAHKRQIGYTTLVTSIASFEAKRDKKICMPIEYFYGTDRRYAHYGIDSGWVQIDSLEGVRGHRFDKIIVDVHTPLTEYEIALLLPSIS